MRIAPVVYAFVGSAVFAACYAHNSTCPASYARAGGPPRGGAMWFAGGGVIGVPGGPGGELAPRPMKMEHCAPGTTCSFDCDDGHCAFACAAGSVCNADCNGGGCELQCAGGAVCNEDCNGGNCHATCAPGSVCNLECSGAGCTHACAPGATCAGGDNDAQASAEVRVPDAETDANEGDASDANDGDSDNDADSDDECDKSGDDSDT